MIDGGDALMLSGETSIGKHPVDSVRVMKEIAQSAQQYLPTRPPPQPSPLMPDTIGHTLHALSVAGFEGISARIVVMTDSGFAARMVSKYRPSLPILAVVTSER